MYSEQNFIAPMPEITISNGSFEWSAPSNIALVKYWGKREDIKDISGKVIPQIPANPSISFTLKNCKTITKLSFVAKETANLSFDLFFDGQPKEEFKPKIQKFLERILPYCPYLNSYHFTIYTSNTFPHSSGIASSASGMAALAINIMSLEKALSPSITEEYFFAKASFLARLGSGSACRSIKGEVVIWGEHNTTAESSNLYGISFADIHPNFQHCQDTILLVDKGEKQVSSTLGHNLMHGHPFASQRFEQAQENLTQMKAILATGDWEKFIQITEREALTLHAMMMTSMPYFILMKPNTLEIIQKIWKFRTENNIPVCFTLDAGANVHVLYPEKVKEQVLQFINTELLGYCQKGQYICDEIGLGAISN